MISHDKIKPDERQEGIDRVRDYLKGGAEYGSIIEQQSNLEFSDLKQEAEAMLASPSPAKRPELHFKLALYRSLKYSVAGSKHCLIHGAVGGIHELAQGQRLMHQHKFD